LGKAEKREQERNGDFQLVSRLWPKRTLRRDLLQEGRPRDNKKVSGGAFAKAKGNEGRDGGFLTGHGAQERRT